MSIVRIEKTNRITTPYNILVGDLVVALCPDEFTANLVGGALAFKAETIRRQKKEQEKGVRG